MQKDSQESVLKKQFHFNKWFVVVVLVLFVLTITNIPDSSSVTSTSQPPVQIQTKNDEVLNEMKLEAEKQLTELMDLAKTAKLVLSYEFSDRANVVYADKGWYSQKVVFKKDLMTKISLLKKTITGYARFEVRDGYSDEKVGEVTVFDVEVYK